MTSIIVKEALVQVRFGGTGQGADRQQVLEKSVQQS